MVDDAIVTDEPENRLSRKQMELVLRRAADLEKASSQGAGAGEELVTTDEVERLGVEAGLSAQSLERALAEVRNGMLAVPAPPPGVLDRVFGPALFTVERIVPGPLADVQRRVEGFFRDQLMRVKRNFGDRVVWEEAEGFLPRMLRTFDWSKRYTMAHGAEVASRVAEVDETHPALRAGAQGAEPCKVRVQLVVELGPLRRDGLTGASVGVLVGGGLAAAALVMPSALEWISLATGSAVGVGSVLGSRYDFRRKSVRIQESLERFLDTLEHER